MPIDCYRDSDVHVIMCLVLFILEVNVVNIPTEFPVPSRVLVITPHPDDSELGCGGTVAKWVSHGAVVVYVLCTNGDKGTSDPDMKPEHMAEIREAEQLAAAKILGIKHVSFLRFPDPRQPQAEKYEPCQPHDRRELPLLGQFGFLRCAPDAVADLLSLRGIYHDREAAVIADE